MKSKICFGTRFFFVYSLIVTWYFQCEQPRLLSQRLAWYVCCTIPKNTTNFLISQRFLRSPKLYEVVFILNYFEDSYNFLECSHLVTTSSSYIEKETRFLIIRSAPTTFVYYVISNVLCEICYAYGPGSCHQSDFMIIHGASEAPTTFFSYDS